MKKFIITVLIGFSSLMSIAAPSEKVLAIFNRSFPDAQNTIWSQEDNGYRVYFTRGDEQFRIWYDGQGIVSKCMRYYSKDLLAPFIRSRVEEKYQNKEISGITEITSPEGIEYVIVLHDDKHWFHIKSDATGNMSVTKKLKKA